jgi:hypothetical protein
MESLRLLELRAKCPKYEQVMRGPAVRRVQVSRDEGKSSHGRDCAFGINTEFTEDTEPTEEGGRGAGGSGGGIWWGDFSSLVSLVLRSRLFIG